MNIALLDFFNDTLKKYSGRLEKKYIEAIFLKVLNISKIEIYTKFEESLDDLSQKKIIDMLEDNLNSSNEIEFDNDSLKNLLDKSIVYLEKNNITDPRMKAELIFEKVLGIDRLTLFLNYNLKISDEKKLNLRKYLEMLGRDKMPLQYIFNEQNFYGYNFYVDSKVLIPRQDTEILVFEALKRLKNNDLVLDLCCGSGAIGLTIALENKSTKVLLTDISNKCISVTNFNMKKLNVKNAKAQESDLFTEIKFNKFNMIVSNPPYIDEIEEKEFMSEDTKHEPEMAFYAKDQGLFYYKEIAKEAKNYLVDGGYLLFEIGFNQKEKVVDILNKEGYKDIQSIKDLKKIDRVIVARK